MLGMIYGLWVGAVIGLAIGAFMFRVAVRQRSFARLDISADFDDSIPEPATGGHVSKKLTKVLDFTAAWVRLPDFQRLVWFNKVIKTLWPHIGKVMYKQVLAQAGPALKDVCKMAPMGILESVDIEKLDLGESPLLIGGLKVYDTREDNLIIETPIMFGSKLVVRVSVKLRVPGTGYAIRLPIEVKHVQMRAIVRITASPLTEALPCVGGVSVSLLKAPYFDAQFRIADSVDWLACPLIHEACQYAVKRSIETLMVYPNKMEFPIMENFGITPPPVGMLQVKICRAAGLPNSDLLGKSDPYCMVNVREERALRTRTINNDLNPTWDQTFHFLVDSIDDQSLTIEVKDDDMGFEDDILGAVELPLDEAECCRKPREWVPVQSQLLEANSAGIVSDAKSFLRQGPGAVKKMQPKIPGHKKKRATKKARKDAMLESNGAFGSVWVEMRYQPFISPQKQEKINKQQMQQQREEKQAQEEEGEAAVTSKKQEQVETSIKKMRGVLTVNVIRAKDLEYKETNEVDPYVRLSLFDPERGATEAFRTSVQVNDATPRWNEKFDFIDIPASSYLTATVFDKASLLSSRKLLKPWELKPDKKLGYVRIAVDEIARNKNLKDEFPLLEAEKGDITLSMHWQRIILEDLSMEEEEFDWKRQQDIADRHHRQKADAQSRRGVESGSLRNDGVGSSASVSSPALPAANGVVSRTAVAHGAPSRVHNGTPSNEEVVAMGDIQEVVAVPTGPANPQGRKVSGFVDDKGQSTVQDDSIGTFVYGPPQ